MMAALWALLTAPFPLFLLVLIVGTIIVTDRIERRDP